MDEQGAPLPGSAQCKDAPTNTTWVVTVRFENAYLGNVYAAVQENDAWRTTDSAIMMNVTQPATPTPTVVPTPTPAPTEAPTDEPVVRETVQPTFFVVPAVMSTDKPVVVATEAPTAVPTAVPTPVPTEAPTPTPTVEPTGHADPHAYAYPRSHTHS